MEDDTYDETRINAAVGAMARAITPILRDLPNEERVLAMAGLALHYERTFLPYEGSMTRTINLLRDTNPRAVS